MKTLTYGTLPKFADFADAMTAATNHTGLFEITCPANGIDSQMLNDLDLFRFGRYLDDNEGVWLGLNRKQLYALCEALVATFGVSGTEFEKKNLEEKAEWAGDFCSSILTTLGFEWV